MGRAPHHLKNLVLCFHQHLRMHLHFSRVEVSRQESVGKMPPRTPSAFLTPDTWSRHLKLLPSVSFFSITSGDIPSYGGCASQLESCFLIRQRPPQFPQHPNRSLDP